MDEQYVTPQSRTRESSNTIDPRLLTINASNAEDPPPTVSNDQPDRPNRPNCLLPERLEHPNGVTIRYILPPDMTALTRHANRSVAQDMGRDFPMFFTHTDAHNVILKALEQYADQCATAFTMAVDQGEGSLVGQMSVSRFTCISNNLHGSPVAGDEDIRHSTAYPVTIHCERGNLDRYKCLQNNILVGHVAEITFWIGAEHRRQGICLSALQLLVNWIFSLRDQCQQKSEELNQVSLPADRQDLSNRLRWHKNYISGWRKVTTVYALIFGTNDAAQGLLRKANFKWQTTLPAQSPGILSDRGRIYDRPVQVWSYLRSDWEDDQRRDSLVVESVEQEVREEVEVGEPVDPNHFEVRGDLRCRKFL